MESVDKIIVAVGSKNPTKIEPVRVVFSYHYPQVEVLGFSVETIVSDQPMSTAEMLKGALHRANYALEKIPEAKFGIGIESGINEEEIGWVEKTLVAIVDQNKSVGLGHSAGIVLPDRIIREIKKGRNLSDIMDELFKTKDIGKGIGMIGIFTKEVVTRATYTEQAIAMALARFIHPQIYSE